MVAMMAWNLDTKIIDVDTDFLFGDLKGEIFMKQEQVDIAKQAPTASTL